MNYKRWLTALFGMPLVIAILVFADNVIIDIVFAVIAAMSLHEYFNSLKKIARPVIWIGYAVSACIAFMHIIPKTFIISFIAILVPSVVVILFMHVVLSDGKRTIKDIMVTLFGICYIPAFLMFIPLISGTNNGRFLVWYIFFSAWLTDTFAFIFGRKIGKHKFSKISPNKTIEGCISGTVGAIIGNLVYTYFITCFFDFSVNYSYIFIVSIILSAIGQIGDFAASSIKRFVGIKDFSNLIPGHGGMLDRFDSVIFIAPFAYFLLVLLV